MAKDSSGKEVKSSTANKYFGVPAGFEYSESEEEEESPPPPTKPKTKKKAVVLSADKGGKSNKKQSERFYLAPGYRKNLHSESSESKPSPDAKSEEDLSSNAFENFKPATPSETTHNSRAARFSRRCARNNTPPTYEHFDYYSRKRSYGTPVKNSQQIETPEQFNIKTSSCLPAERYLEVKTERKDLDEKEDELERTRTCTLLDVKIGEKQNVQPMDDVSKEETKGTKSKKYRANTKLGCSPIESNEEHIKIRIFKNKIVESTYTKSGEKNVQLLDDASKIMKDGSKTKDHPCPSEENLAEKNPKKKSETQILEKKDPVQKKTKELEGSKTSPLKAEERKKNQIITEEVKKKSHKTEEKNVKEENIEISERKILEMKQRKTELESSKTPSHLDPENGERKKVQLEKERKKIQLEDDRKKVQLEKERKKIQLEEERKKKRIYSCPANEKAAEKKKSPEKTHKERGVVKSLIEQTKVKAEPKTLLIPPLDEKAAEKNLQDMLEESMKKKALNDKILMDNILREKSRKEKSKMRLLEENTVHDKQQWTVAIWQPLPSVVENIEQKELTVALRSNRPEDGQEKKNMTPEEKEKERILEDEMIRFAFELNQNKNENSKDLLEDIPLPDETWEEKLDNNTLEDPSLQQQRAYTQRFLEESAGIVGVKRAAGQKMVIDSQVMVDYGNVYYNWSHAPQLQNTTSASPDPYSDVITMVEGDLFLSQLPLVHCVSADMWMSSGVAVNFRRMFGHVAELLNQRRRPGEVAVLKHSNRFIYYLVTKEFYLAKPSGVPVLSQCLWKVREHCQQNGIREIAMPKIGCGRDQLHWAQVSDAVHTAFVHSGVRVFVHHVKDEASWGRPPPAKRSKLSDSWNAPQDQPPSRPIIVLHHFQQTIVDPRPPIGRIFLASRDASSPEGATIHLNNTFKIWPEFLRSERKIATCIPLFGGHIYALVCRREANGPVDFIALHKAAKELARITSAIGTQRLAIEGFILPDDQIVTFKVITLLKLALVNQSVTLNVAWPVEPPYGNLIRSSQQGLNYNQQQQPQLMAPDEYDY